MLGSLITAKCLNMTYLNSVLNLKVNLTYFHVFNDSVVLKTKILSIYMIDPTIMDLTCEENLLPKEPGDHILNIKKEINTSDKDIIGNKTIDLLHKETGAVILDIKKELNTSDKDITGNKTIDISTYKTEESDTESIKNNDNRSSLNYRQSLDLINWDDSIRLSIGQPYSNGISTSDSQNQLDQTFDSGTIPVVNKHLNIATGNLLNASGIITLNSPLSSNSEFTHSTNSIEDDIFYSVNGINVEENSDEFLSTTILKKECVTSKEDQDLTLDSPKSENKTNDLSTEKSNNVSIEENTVAHKADILQSEESVESCIQPEAVNISSSSAGKLNETPNCGTYVAISPSSSSTEEPLNSNLTFKDCLSGIDKSIPENLEVVNLDDLEMDPIERCNQQQAEISDLKLKLNAAQQHNASLELQIRQNEEIVIKTQAESLRTEQNYQQEVKQLKEKLNENSKIIEKDRIRELEEQMKECKVREEELLDEISQRTKDEVNIKKIMEQYAENIQMRFADNQKLELENSILKTHLTNLELAFSDVHSKYEKTKAALQGVRANEEAVLAELDAAQSANIQHEERYKSLKSYAYTQIENANKENHMMKEQQEAEVNKLNALIKRLEIKVCSLEQSVAQKEAECEQLSALCDEVTGKKV